MPRFQRDERTSEIARSAARARWGPPRERVRIDTLPPKVAQAIRLLIEAQQEALERALDAAEQTRPERRP